jgi:hypothetical protein
MKTRFVFAMAIAALIAGLASCSVLSNVLPSGMNPLASAQEKAEKRANAEVASGIGLTGMTRKMMFNMIYAQVYFVGGFAPGIYLPKDGEGAAWKVTSKPDGEKPSVIETERALLKKNADGSSWWYLSWKSSDGEETQEWAFEALMDKDMQAVKIRYFNEDVGRIEESAFDKPSAKSKPNDEKAPPEKAPASQLDKDELGRMSKGKETVKTAAGTFKADKLVWEYADEENGKKAVYTWWVDPAVPGGLVKYDYRADKDSITGELVSLKKGYATKFKSF